MAPSAEARPALLLVDDDPLVAQTLAAALAPDFAVECCASRREALARLEALPAPPPLALVDLGLPPDPHSPAEGFQLITELLAHAPTMCIYVLSGQTETRHARHARALGAVDFVAKPCDPRTLRAALRRALQFCAPDADQFVGASPALARLRAQIAQFAPSPFPVLIEGESGSGKELAATCLHRLSDRAAEPFLALNCAAIAPTLVEPTLFGHAKGAFTGATEARAGYFEDARGGTLLLDEIGELPLEVQAKLLRVLETGEYSRVGETQPRRARARVLAATNRDLRREMRAGRFRADLYHRLSVLVLTVPALRELGEDRRRLLAHYRDHYARRLAVRPFALEAEAERLWLAYPFPGNVRELRNIVIRLLAKYPGQRVGAEELQAEFDPEASAGVAPADPVFGVEQALAQLRRQGRVQLDELLAAIERSYIRAALELAGGNMSQAARLLGLKRSTLYDRRQSPKDG